MQKNKELNYWNFVMVNVSLGKARAKRLEQASNLWVRAINTSKFSCDFRLCHILTDGDMQNMIFFFTFQTNHSI